MPGMPGMPGMEDGEEGEYTEEQLAAARGQLPPGYGMPGKRLAPKAADVAKMKNKRKAERTARKKNRR